MMSNHRSTKLLLVFAMAMFGTLGLFIRAIPLPSSIIALVRGSVGAAFLLLVCAVRKTPPDKAAIRRNLKWLLPCGIAMGFNWILLFEAYRYTTVAIATLCYYFSPVIILLLSPLVLKEKLTRKKIFCILIALVGMGLVSNVLQGVPEGETTTYTGVVMGLVAAVLYAIIVLTNKRLEGISSQDATMTQLGISAVVMLIYTLLTVNFSTLTYPPMGWGLFLGFGSMLVVAIFHTGFCYNLYFSAIAVLPAQTSALFSYIDPVVAVLLAAFLLREPMTLLNVVGAVLILGATLYGELSE